MPKHWQNQLVDIFFKFVNNSDDIYAADVLLLLTLSPFGGLHKLGIREKIEYFNEDILENELPIAERSIEISKAMIKPLRNELRYQRRKVHPNFLKVQYPESCQKAYKSLFKALSYDEILTYVACSYCYNKCLSSSEYDMNRIFYLLSSSSKNIFGGLRAIGFQFYQAEFFMKHAAVLHNYLKALWLSIESNSITTNKVTTELNTKILLRLLLLTKMTSFMSQTRLFHLLLVIWKMLSRKNLTVLILLLEFSCLPSKQRLTMKRTSNDIRQLENIPR